MYLYVCNFYFCFTGAKVEYIYCNWPTQSKYISKYINKHVRSISTTFDWPDLHLPLIGQLAGQRSREPAVLGRRRIPKRSNKRPIGLGTLVVRLSRLMSI